MNQPLINQDKFDTEGVAAKFLEMAAKIKLNGVDAFGGAFVIVPPVNGGSSLEMLVIDNQANPAIFWSTLKTQAELMLGSIEQSMRTGQGYR